MTNPTTASPVTRPPEVQQLMEGLKYAGYSSADKEGNWKMVWFKSLIDYIAHLEAQPKPQSDDGKEDWDAARAWFKHRFNGDSTKWTLGEVAFLAGMFNEHRALSQAPVPTTNGGKTDE